MTIYKRIVQVGKTQDGKPDINIVQGVNYSVAEYGADYAVVAIFSKDSSLLDQVSGTVLATHPIADTLHCDEADIDGTIIDSDDPTRIGKKIWEV